jgi:putative salt-induced outer membrane protein YdiY
VRLNDQSLSGAFFSASEGQALFTRDGNERLALSDIRSASQSRTQFTPFSLDWGVRLDLALSLADGNSSTEASNALLEADFQDDLNAHLLTVLLAREEGEGLLTKDQLDVDYGYRRFISQRWYGAANAEYFQDTLKDIDLRITLGAGMGIQVIDNSLENLATDLSLSAVQENIGGDSSTKPALRWGLDYQRFLFAKTVEVFHRQSILQLFSDENGQVYSSSTGIRYAFSERIDTNFRIDLAYESDPPPGNEKTDTTYSLGVGLKF